MIGGLEQWKDKERANKIREILALIHEKYPNKSMPLLTQGAKTFREVLSSVFTLFYSIFFNFLYFSLLFFRFSWIFKLVEVIFIPIYRLN